MVNIESIAIKVSLEFLQVELQVVTLDNIAIYYVLNRIIYNSPDTPKDLLGIKRIVDDLAGKLVYGLIRLMIFTTGQLILTAS